MSRADEIYNQIGKEPTKPIMDPIVNGGDNPVLPDVTQYAFKISREAVLKEMNRLPEGAAVWSPYGVGEYDARQILRDELWKRVEAHVQKYMYAPDGKTLIEVK